MQHLFFVLDKEYRDHLVSIGESLLPVLIVKVFLDVLFRTVLVLSDDEFVEGILENPLKDPLPQDLEVRLRTFF